MKSDFEKSLKRPKDFCLLPAEERWAIDKRLGILDWDGECNHGVDCTKCPECKARMDSHYIYEKKVKIQK